MILSTMAIALIAQSYVLLLIALLGLCVIVRRLRKQLLELSATTPTLDAAPALEDTATIPPHSENDEKDVAPSNSDVPMMEAEENLATDVALAESTIAKLDTPNDIPQSESPASNNTDDFIKLRNLAAFQFRTIHKLQQKLDEATTAAEKNEVIKQLEQELYRHIRFLNESDTCMQLLEEELHRANQELARLQEADIEIQQLRDENARLASQIAALSP